VFVTLVALALRLTLVLRYPLLYDIDAYGRFTNRAHPFNTPWTPLFQVVIYLLTRVADSILAVRLLSAFFGATAALAFWLLLRRAFGAPVAYLGALLLALDPLFVTFSVVPYQEGLFLTLAFLALWLALAPDKIRWLTLVLGLAGLTRYEGWLLALLIWLLLLWRRWRADSLTWRYAAGSALALAWAPLLWIGVNRNVSPVGIETLTPTLDPASLLAVLGEEWPAWQLRLGLVGGMVALGGLLWLGWQARRGRELAWLLLAFLLGDLLTLAFLRPFAPGNLRLPLLSLPVIIVGVSGLLVAGARLLWRAVGQRHMRVGQRLPMAGAFALATAALLIWYLPLAMQRVAAYGALVRPAYLAANELGSRAPDTPVAVIDSSSTDFYAFVFYAQQDGWHGQATELNAAAAIAPASLAEALIASHARLLIVYGPANASAAVAALAQQALLLPGARGPGYTVWNVQAAPAAAT
jgi:hypothetical protein